MTHRYIACCFSFIALFATSVHAQDHSSHAQQEQHPMPAEPERQSKETPGKETNKDDQSSEAEHVAPEPPQHLMGSMSYREMASMMQMDDRKRFGKVLVDQLEWRNASDGNAAVWSAQAWYGGDYNKVFLKTEGERVRNTIEDARVELSWDRIVSRWWHVQAGAREDFGEGPSRTWAAVGVEGLAPYWFDVEATLYVGDSGRTAARVKVEYDLLFTQRLILQPEVEANVYGKADRERQLGSGLSDIDLALRLRYEIRREVAPYIGIAWRVKFAGTADYARAAGLDSSDVQLVAGFRLWF